MPRFTGITYDEWYAIIFKELIVTSVAHWINPAILFFLAWMGMVLLEVGFKEGTITFEVQNSTNLNQTTALHLFTTTITETQFPATALATEIITSTATETIMLTTFVAETIYVTETAAPRNQPIHASFLPEGSSPPSNKILNMIIEQDLLLNNLHSPLFDPSTGSQGVSGFGDTPRHFAHGFDIFNITVRGNVIISGSNSDCEISAHEANEMIPEATCSDKLLEILEMDGCEINWIERFLVWSLHLGLLSTKFLVVCVVAFSFIAGGT